MLTTLEFIAPFVFVILILLPLIKVFRGKADKRTSKKRLYTHISLFFALVAFVFIWQLGAHSIFAATGANPLEGTMDALLYRRDPRQKIMLIHITDHTLHLFSVGCKEQ